MAERLAADSGDGDFVLKGHRLELLITLGRHTEVNLTHGLLTHS